MSRAFSVRSASRSAHAVSTSARSAVTSSGRVSGLVTPGLSHRVGPVYQLNLQVSQKDAGALMKGRGYSAGQLRPPYPRGVDPPPIKPFKRSRILIPLLFTVILRQIDAHNGAVFQLPQRCHGLVGVREQIATCAGVAVNADNAATNPAADPVDRNTEMDGHFRNAEPAGYLCPTGCL